MTTALRNTCVNHTSEAINNMQSYMNKERKCSSDWVHSSNFSNGKLQDPEHIAVLLKHIPETLEGGFFTDDTRENDSLLQRCKASFSDAYNRRVMKDETEARATHDTINKLYSDTISQSTSSETQKDRLTIVQELSSKLKERDEALQKELATLKRSPFKQDIRRKEKEIQKLNKHYQASHHSKNSHQLYQAQMEVWKNKGLLNGETSFEECWKWVGTKRAVKMLITQNLYAANALHTLAHAIDALFQQSDTESSSSTSDESTIAEAENGFKTKVLETLDPKKQDITGQIIETTFDLTEMIKEMI